MTDNLRKQNWDNTQKFEMSYGNKIDGENLSLENLNARLKVNDYLIIPILFIWTLLLHGFGINSLEFFRHTEADRTLIAWEMVESGNYIVPHLLDSVILTKPPLFYWFVALFIGIFSSTTEWVSRLPSVFVSGFYVIAHYVFFRYAGAPTSVALLSGMFASSGLLFISLANVAEIDMLHGFLCMAAISLGYFSFVRGQLLPTIGVYVFASLAFLTKGPPIVFFLGAIFSCYFIWLRFAGDIPDSLRRVVSKPHLLVYHFVGIFVFVAIISFWLFLLASEVGWNELVRQIRVEVFDRVFAPSSRGRGHFYYLGTILTALVPGSIFLVIACIRLIRRVVGMDSEIEDSLFTNTKPYIAYNFMAVVLGTLLLSLAEGKSSRYFFPLYGSAICLCTYGAVFIKNTVIEQFSFKVGSIAFLIAALGLFVTAFFLELSGVDRASIWVAATSLGLPAALCSLSCLKRNRVFVLGSLALIMFGLKVGQAKVYAPHRNYKYSVQEIVKDIEKQVPPSTPIHTLEMFERWVIYYLKRDGYKTYRLTPGLVKEIQENDDKIYLLLNEKEESWRLMQLSQYGDDFQLIKHYDHEKQPLLLVLIDASMLSYLEPKETFPTMPSKPFYREAAM